MNLFKNGIDIPLPGKITLNIGLGVFLLSIIMYAGGSPRHEPLHNIGNVMILWITIFLHEFAHLYSSRKLGFTCDKISLTFWGGFVKPDIAPKNAIKDEDGKIVYDWRMPIAGPMINLLLAIVSWTIVYMLDIQYMQYGDNMLVFFAYLNLILLFNLLPIIGFDGWHILRYLLTKYTKKPTKISMIVGFSCLAIALPLWIIY